MKIISARSMLLQALLDGPNYGLGLKRVIERRAEGKIKVAEGALYPALQILVKQGLAESSLSAGAGPGRPKVLYKLTNAGAHAATKEKKITAAIFNLKVAENLEQKESPLTKFDTSFLECEECWKAIEPGREVWFEYRISTGEPTLPGTDVPEEDSQGYFPFCRECTRRLTSKLMSRTQGQKND